MEFQSFSDEFRRSMERATRVGLLRAGAFAVTELQATLSTVNPGKRVKYARKKTASGRAATHTVYNTASKPGEPPRQRTGWGKGHVAMQEVTTADGAPAVRIGVPESAIYLAYHEAGINYARAGKQQRPWLVNTIEKYREVLVRLFMTGANG